jgi:hypothetical protein
MPKEITKRRFPRKLLVYLSIALLAFLGLLVGLVLLLPWAVSSHWFKDFAEKQAAGAIHRPIRIDVLRWQWPGSIQIEGLRITDDPAFSERPLLKLKTLRLAVDPFGLLDRTLRVDCKLSGLEIGLIRHQNGRTNLESLLRQIRTVESDKKKTVRGTQIPAVPVDLAGSMQLSQINIRVDDHLNGKRLRFKDAAINLDFPALFSAPVRLNVKSELEVDGNEVPPFQLTVVGENFFNSAGALDLSEAKLDLNGSLPGAQISIRGHPASEEVESKVTIDLARLTAILKPLLPANLADTDFSGELQLQMNASGNPQQTIDFTTRLAGRQLGIAGELVQNNKIGPFNFKSTHTGQISIIEKEIAIRSGELQILENCRLQWNGTVKNTSAAPATVDLRLEKLSFDLVELFEALKAMTPQWLLLSFDTTKPSLLEITGAGYSGILGSGAGAVTIKDLSLLIPSYSLAAKEHGLSTAGRHLAVSIQDLNLALKDHFPVSVSLQTSAAADSLDLNQMSRLHVEGFKMPQLNLRVENITAQGRPGPGKLQLAGVLQMDTLQLKAEQDLLLTQLYIPQFKLEAEEIGGSLNAIPGKSNVTAAIKVGMLQTTGDFSLSIENLDIPRLKLGIAMNRPEDDARPGRAELTASMRIDHLGVTDEPVIELHKLNIPSLTLSATGFQSSADFMPQRVEMNSGITLQSLTLDGNPKLQIAQLEIPRFTVKADGIKKSAQAPFGIVSRLAVNESLALQKFQMPGIATLQEIRQSIAAKVVLAPGAVAIVTLNDFNLTASDLQITKQLYGPIQTSLNLETQAAALKIERLQPLTVHIDGLKARAEVGKLIEVAFEASAKNSGWSSINSKGTAVINLARLSAVAKNFLKPYAQDLKLSGQAGLDWNLAGRRPRERELKRLADPTALRPGKDLDFLNKVNISGRLKGVGVNMRLKDGRNLKIGNVFSAPSIDYRFNPQSGRGQFDAHIALKQIKDLPPLGHLPKPLSVDLTLAGEHHYLDTVSLTEALEIKTYGLKQNARVSLYGIDRLLKKVRNTPLPMWLQKIGATVNADLNIEDTKDLAFLPPNLEVSGGLKLGAHLRLKPGQQITVKTSAQTRQMNFKVADSIAVKGLKLDLDLMKNFRILDQAAPGVKSGASYLSDEVLQSDILAPSATTPANAAVEQFLGETHKRQKSRHTLSFESARLNRLRLPLEITHAISDFYLKKGLPTVDYIQLNLLGGTLIGSLSFFKHLNDIYIQSRLQFSGLNTFNLFSNAEPVDGVPDDREGEISGQVSVVLPLTTKLEFLLQRVQAHIMFSQIGSQSLARLLYALDPYESNEAIVSQRRLLRTGSPRWIKMTIRNGNLALEGEAAVKGIRVALPRLTRFNISNLSGLRPFDSHLLQLQPLIQALAILAADHMVVAKEGQIKFGN